MQLSFLDAHFGKEAIDGGHCHIEGLWLQTEFAMDVYYPFNQEASGGIFDLAL